MGNSVSKIVTPAFQQSVKEWAPKPSEQQEFASRLPGDETTLAEGVFHALLTHERRRAERSGKLSVLMLLDANLEDGTSSKILKRAFDIILNIKRETDLVGWYKQDVILGVIFTEVSVEGNVPITQVLRDKVETALIKHLGVEPAAKIAISMHLFPESWDKDHTGWDKDHTGWVADSTLYPDFKKKGTRKRQPQVTKRMMDIAGSAVLLFLLSPLLAAIAAIIKLTSKGPVIHEQEHLGQFGARFMCKKFRTTYVNNDSKIRQEYVQQFIAGKDGLDKSEKSEKPVYKLTNDPRITPIGHFLRKTSLDELPQLLNVLRGEMSLVGPRPPVPYEFEVYDIWHRRRVLEVKPGVTGLWQVSGRNRMLFDEIVRLDLQYCESWSLWLDLKILFATPRAVFHEDSAC